MPPPPLAERPSHTGSPTSDSDSASPSPGDIAASTVEVPEPTIETRLEPVDVEPRGCSHPEDRARLGPGEWMDDSDGLASLPPVDLDTLPGTTISLAVGDIDGDEVLDLVVGHPTGVRAFRGNGDATFSAFAHPWPGPAEPADLVSGVLLVDLDDDDDLDALVTHRFREPLRYMNAGDGRFERFEDLPHTPKPAHMGPAIADVDGDGELELVVGGNQSKRFRSTDETPPHPAAAFELSGARLAEGAPLPARAHDGYTFVTGLLDVDGDTLIDAYLLNDHGSIAPPNAILWGGADTPSTLASDEERDAGLELGMAAMGLGVGDLDEDGLPDFAISNWGPPVLLLSGGGHWYDAAFARGIRDTPDATVGWGTEMGDIDNDGDLDIYMVFGHIPGADDPGRENERRQPDKLFLNDGEGHFVDVAPDWLLDDDRLGRVAMLVDLDRDGFLDAIVGDQVHPPRIWRARCDASAWLTVHLVQPAPNSDAIGARVQVVVGERVHTRWLQSGGRSFGASHPHSLHFGLGELDRVDRIVVTWPDGSVSAHAGVATRREVQITRE